MVMQSVVSKGQVGASSSARLLSEFWVQPEWTRQNESHYANIRTVEFATFNSKEDLECGALPSELFGLVDQKSVSSVIGKVIRRAFRTASTSITSWVTAPATGGR